MDCELCVCHACGPQAGINVMYVALSQLSLAWWLSDQSCKVCFASWHSQSILPSMCSFTLIATVLADSEVSFGSVCRHFW